MARLDDIHLDRQEAQGVAEDVLADPDAHPADIFAARYLMEMLEQEQPRRNGGDFLTE